MTVSEIRLLSFIHSSCAALAGSRGGVPAPEAAQQLPGQLPPALCPSTDVAAWCELAAQQIVIELTPEHPCNPG